MSGAIGDRDMLVVEDDARNILLIGAHLTGLVQVEDTHLHGPMTMF